MSPVDKARIRSEVGKFSKDDFYPVILVFRGLLIHRR